MCTSDRFKDKFQALLRLPVPSVCLLIFLLRSQKGPLEEARSRGVQHIRHHKSLKEPTRDHSQTVTLNHKNLPTHSEYGPQPKPCNAGAIRAVQARSSPALRPSEIWQLFGDEVLQTLPLGSCGLAWGFRAEVKSRSVFG